MLVPIRLKEKPARTQAVTQSHLGTSQRTASTTSRSLIKRCPSTAAPVGSCLSPEAHSPPVGTLLRDRITQPSVRPSCDIYSIFWVARLDLSTCESIWHNHRIAEGPAESARGWIARSDGAR